MKMTIPVDASAAGAAAAAVPAAEFDCGRKCGSSRINSRSPSSRNICVALISIFCCFIATFILILHRFYVMDSSEAIHQAIQKTEDSGIGLTK